MEQHWSVRQSARARRLSVRVFRNGGVEIVVPPRTSAHRVSAFVSEHREWIERQRKRAVPQINWPWPPTSLSLSAIDEQWRCTLVQGVGPIRLRALMGNELTGNELQLRGLQAQGPHDDGRDRVRQALLRWLVHHARARFESPLRELASIMGLQAGDLQVRCQRTRWGSCSRRGTISLNVCLLFQRPRCCAI